MINPWCRFIFIYKGVCHLGALDSVTKAEKSLQIQEVARMFLMDGQPEKEPWLWWVQWWHLGTCPRLFQSHHSGKCWADVWHHCWRAFIDEPVLVDILFWETDPNELKREILSSHTASRIRWLHFLTLTEKSWLAEYTSQWQEKYYDMKDAIFVLNQNPKCHSFVGPKWRNDHKPSQSAYMVSSYLNL